MTEPTSPRDELVTLLSEHRIAMASFSYSSHPICDGCEWSSSSDDSDVVMDEFNAPLADVLLAAGPIARVRELCAQAKDNPSDYPPVVSVQAVLRALGDPPVAAGR